MHKLTDKLCDYIEYLKRKEVYSELDSVYDNCYCDFLSAIISGSNTEVAEQMHHFIRERGANSNKESSVIGLDAKTSPEWAAFANASIAHAKEIDDGHRYATGIHPGTVIFPVALALGERYSSSHDDIKQAVIIGYETACHIGKIMNPEHRNKSFHSAGTINVLGAVVTASILLKLDKTQIMEAIGLAASMASGIFSFLNNPPDVKRIHVGHAAWSGVIAAFLVQSGIKGPSGVLEHEEGFIKAFAPDTFNRLQSEDYEFDRFEMKNVYFKPCGACGQAFSTIDAIIKIKNEMTVGNKVDLEEISAIHVSTYKAAAVLQGQIPINVQEAQFHLPFLIVTILMYGKITDQTLGDAIKNKGKMRILLDKITVKEDLEYTKDFPKHRSSTVKLTSESKGLDFEETVHIPKGMPDNPLTYSQIQQKYLDVTSSVMTVVSQKDVLDCLHGRGVIYVNNINKLLS